MRGGHSGGEADRRTLDQALRGLSELGREALNDVDEPSLAELFGAAARMQVGSPAFREIVAVLDGAQRFEFDDDLISALARTLRGHSHTVEYALDRIPPLERGVWIEFSQKARLAGQEAAMPEADNGAKAPPQPDWVGYLISPMPGDQGTLVCLGAWRHGGGTAQHAMATLALDLRDLHAHGRRAAQRYSRVPLECNARMAKAARALMPPDFQDLMAAQVANQELDVQQGLVFMELRKALLEAPFIYACLLALVAEGVAVRPGPAGAASRVSVDAAATPPRSRWRPFRRPEPACGFVAAGETLFFAPPPDQGAGAGEEA